MKEVLKPSDTAATDKTDVQKKKESDKRQEKSMSKYYWAKMQELASNCAAWDCW
jgi:hypothetical protein